LIDGVARPPTLTDAAAEAIRRAIFRGSFQPGDSLREPHLSESLNVSRSTVREALRELQDENLVQLIPHRGAIVTQMTYKNAREVYTMRALLEPYAVGLAMEAGAYETQELAKLCVLAEQLGELERQGDSDFEVVKANVEFHEGICRPCCHDMLLAALKRLQSLTWLFLLNARYARLYQTDKYLGGPSHADIIDAIKSGDIQIAQAKLRQHINDGGEALMAYLVQQAE
jgi:DNA-binding GntR family transcriptional regulator